MQQLVNRVTAMMLAPQSEWPVVAREGAAAFALFGRYVAALALIPAVAGFVGSSLIGAFTPIGSGLADAAIAYVLNFVTIPLLAMIVRALAPTFGGDRGSGNALKLAVYSYTPAWLAGVFLLIPGLSFLTILGLYGFYLLWLGLPPLTGAPRDKAFPYALAVVFCAVILAIVTAHIPTLLMRGLAR